MSLGDEQSTFLRHLCLLVPYLTEKGFRVRGGELYRSREEQARLVAKGKSRVMESGHRNRLAIDLILDWHNGEKWIYLTKTEAYADAGRFWKALDPGVNIWGGDWKGFPDGNHFERLKVRPEDHLPGLREGDAGLET